MFWYEKHFCFIQFQIAGIYFLCYRARRPRPYKEPIYQFKVGKCLFVLSKADGSVSVRIGKQQSTAGSNPPAF